MKFNPLDNYILKNLFMFVGVVVLSMLLVSFAQMYTFDRDALNTQKEKLLTVNENFEQQINDVVESNFAPINFLVQTSYPEVAIDFGMYQQFYDVVEKLLMGKNKMGILIYDKHGMLLSSRHTPTALSPHLKNISSLASSSGAVYFGKNEIAYIKPFLSDGKLVGYLGGMRSLASFTKVLETAYYEQTLDYNQLQPEINIKYGKSSSEKPKIIFSHKEPQKLFYTHNKQNAFMILVIMSVVVAFSTYFLRRSLHKPFVNILDVVKHVSNNEIHDNNVSIPKDPMFKDIALALLDMNKIRNEFEQKKREHEISKQIVHTAQQVAHDIRSPLAALTAVTQGLSELSEDKRIMVRSAVQRINDIANDLAERGNQSKSGEIQGVESDKVSVEFLTSVIDTLVSEKRLQHRSHLGISIQSALSARSYGLFAKIQLAQFKRVLSNLVNNAVEALGENGTITVDMKTNANDDICISIADTGKGIAPENLAKIFERGVSVDKKEGQGLGLFHARESVESWGGKIEIVSQQTSLTPPNPPDRPPLTLRGGDQTSGTTVTITLPRQNEPDWFVPELFIYEKMTVIILDDDQSIHQIWQGRFETLKTQIELHHFSNGDALRRWYLNTTDGSDGRGTLQRRAGLAPTAIGPMLILCDYEILGSSESGLDVIEELQLQDHTVLVTSRFEEKNVRERCKNLGIRLLPKNLAGFVPIKLKEISQDLQYVLIDDSRMNRTTWEIMAKRHQKKIVTFERPKDFYDVAEKINKNVQLYVDLNLGHGQNGKDVTKKISEKGFEKVYLYTGEVSVDASQMPWLAGVVGKGVPFVKHLNFVT